MREITRETKHKVLRREIGFRRSVYALRVRDGKMTAEQAAHEIAVMEAIAADYAPAPDPDLFRPPPAKEAGPFHVTGIGCLEVDGEDVEGVLLTGGREAIARAALLLGKKVVIQGGTA